jgi:septum formation protein
VLASASPARLRTLRSAGIPADVVVSGVDESTVEATDAGALSGTLARMKAQAVADRLRGQGEALVLGCDSVLAFDGEILGKPADAAEATKRWQRMRGGAGVLHTGHCLIHIDEGRPDEGRPDETGGKRIAEEVGATTVQFADVSDAEIAAYVATGEPLRVAGAFTIDGIGGPFVEGVDGDPGTVIGLSLPLLRRLLATLGVPIHSYWHAER